MTISERILSLLKLHGQTQKAIADLLDIRPSTVNNWVKQNLDSIPSGYIMPLTKFFGITPEELLTGKPESYINLNEDETKLLNIYRNTDDDTKIIIMADAIRETRAAK